MRPFCLGRTRALACMLLSLAVFFSLSAFEPAHVQGAGMATITGLSTDGVGYVTYSQSGGTVDAQIGRWDSPYYGYNPSLEPYGYSYFYVDIDVNDGGYASFSFQLLTYDAGIWDWLDIYMQTPTGTVSLLSHFGKPGNQYGTYHESSIVTVMAQDLNSWKNQRVRFVFAVRQDGYGDQTMARLIGFTTKAGSAPSYARSGDYGCTQGTCNLDPFTNLNDSIGNAGLSKSVISGSSASLSSAFDINPANSEWVGSSVNFKSGNLYHSQQVGPITLSYNSLDPYSGPLGPGWTHNFNLLVTSTPDGSLILKRGDGNTIFFSRGSNGIFHADAKSGDTSTIVQNVDDSYTQTTKYGSVFHFDSSGKLTRITDRNGNRTTLTYYGDDLVSITDSTGRAVQIGVDGGKITSITDFSGKTYSISYSAGSLSAITDPLGSTWRYLYDEKGRMVEKTNPAGSIMAYTYNADGMLTATTDPEGGVKTISYDTQNGSARVTQKDGGVWVHKYDINLAAPVEVIDPDGKSTKYTFDSDRHLTSTTYPDGTTKTYKYDSIGNVTSLTDALGNVTTISYNNQNRVTAVTDPQGNRTTFSYDGKGNMSSSTSASGKTTQIERDGAGNITSLTAPGGRTTQYTYDQYNQVTAVTDPNAATTELSRDASGRISSQKDRNGNITLFSYNERGDLIKVTDPLGGVTSFTYDANGKRSSVTNALKDTTLFEYNYKGQITKKIDALGNVTTYEYGGAGCASCGGGTDKLTAITYPNGATVSFEYDLLGRRTRVVDPAGNPTAFTYDVNGNVLGLIDPSGNTTQFDYDEKNEPIGVTDPLGNSTTYTYDAAGNCISRTDAKGNTTRFEYNSNKQLIRVTDALGGVTTISYGDASSGCGDGKPVSITNPSGNTLRYEYDLAGRKVKTIDGAGNITSFSYDANGNMLSRTDPNGNVTRFSYDAKGQLTRSTDPLGRVTTLSYGDATSGGGYGKPFSITGPDGNTTTFSYDLLGRIIKATDANGNAISYTYDAMGRMLTATDPNGNTASFSHDGLSRLREATDPLQGVVALKYSSTGELREATDPNGNATTYGYDALGRVVSAASPDSGTTFYTYNGDGTLKAKTDANGITATLSYDGAGRLTGQSFPDSSENVSFSYDSVASRNGKGHPTGMTDPSGTTTYDYDSRGRIVREVKTVLGVSYTTSYEYDAVGNLSALTYPSGRRVEVSYNEVRRPIGVSHSTTGLLMPLASEITYDGAGRMTSLVLGNGLGEQWSYDAAGRISSLKADPQLPALIYSCDRAGNITSIAGLVPGQFSQTYSYDPLNRLESTKGCLGPQNFTYDANGNRLTRKLPKVSYGYDYVGNRLVTVSGENIQSFHYDANGNTISDGEKEFTYNQANRLSVVYKGGALISEYIYNGKGQRVIKRVFSGGEDGEEDIDGARTIIFHYDLKGRLIEETTHTGKLIRDYVYLEGSPLALIEKKGTGEESFFYHNDHLGSPKVLTDANQGVSWRAELDPFGDEVQNAPGSDWSKEKEERPDCNLIHAPQNIKNNLRFPGQYFDRETGLNYNYFRHYDPKTGRYREADPIGLLGGVNPYRYASNNPVSRIDPTGLEDDDFYASDFSVDFSSYDSGGGSYFDTGNSYSGIAANWLSGNTSGGIGDSGWAYEGFNYTGSAGLSGGSSYNWFSSQESFYGVEASCQAESDGVFNSVGDMLWNNLTSTPRRMYEDAVDSLINLWSWANGDPLGVLFLVTGAEVFRGIQAVEEVVSLATRTANFYVTPSGTAITSTGYRAIGGPAVERAMEGNIMSGSGPTYITFENLSEISASEAKNLLQLKYEPSHYASFNTLQIIDDLRIPSGRWNTSLIPEPRTTTFPEFGTGGATQAITTTPINNYVLRLFGR